MIDESVRLPVIKVQGREKRIVEDTVAREVPITIFFNKQEIVTILCSPNEIKELAVGFLMSEGFLAERGDLYTLGHHCEENVVRVEGRPRPGQAEMMGRRVMSSCCGKNRVSFNFENDASLLRQQRSELRITLDEAVYLANYLDDNSALFRETGGTHNGGVSCGGKVLFTSHDIGRHNVLDKLMGKALLNDLDLSNHVLFFSGRVSSEILAKVAKMNIPILVARSAPSDLAIALAEDLNITLLGFARGDRLNIYTAPERIKLPPLLCRGSRAETRAEPRKLAGMQL